MYMNQQTRCIFKHPNLTAATIETTTILKAQRQLGREDWNAKGAAPGSVRGGSESGRLKENSKRISECKKFLLAGSGADPLIRARCYSAGCEAPQGVQKVLWAQGKT